MTAETPIACTLGAGDYRERMAWIADLNTRNLRRHEQDGLTLRLIYDPAARTEVEALVAREQACCAFLDFDIAGQAYDLVLTIRAPERAREAGEAIFAAFTTGSTSGQASACGCC